MNRIILIFIAAVMVFPVFVGCQSDRPRKSNSSFYPGSPSLDDMPRSGRRRAKARKSKPNPAPMVTEVEESEEPPDSDPGFSAPAPKHKKKSNRSQNNGLANSPRGNSTTIGASVGSDGVAVFETPSFDGAVVGYLERDQKVRASIKGFKGAGGFGVFHKIAVNGKEVGYVTDADLVFNKNEMPLKKLGDPFQPGPFGEEEDEDYSEPAYLSRRIGGFFGSYQFAEKVAKKTLRANHYFYGLKMTGPGTFFDGPPIDANILFSVTPPSYYSDLTDATPSGFMVFADSLLFLPFLDWPSGVIQYGFGLMALYTKYTLTIGGLPIDSQEIRIGGVFGLSTTVTIGPKISVQGDIRYFIEQTSYLGYGISVITPY